MSVSAICPRCGRGVGTMHPRPECDAFYAQAYRLATKDDAGIGTFRFVNRDDCVPHQYPFETEHEWQHEWGQSNMGDTVEYEIRGVRFCRRCGWRVSVTTTLTTLPAWRDEGP